MKCLDCSPRTVGFLLLLAVVIASTGTVQNLVGLLFQVNSVMISPLVPWAASSSKLDWESEDLMRYAIVIERAENNFSAYVPDLPGCVATGDTFEEVESQILEAIAFHLDGLREDGVVIPQPSSVVEYLEVAA